MGLKGQGVAGGPALGLELGPGPRLAQGWQQREQQAPSLGYLSKPGSQCWLLFLEPLALFWPFLGDPFIRPAWIHKLFRDYWDGGVGRG